MELKTFSVTNYRSITSAPKLAIRPNLTVLIGPNNEGKSNLLRALAVALSTLERLHGPPRMWRATRARGPTRYAPLARTRAYYDWKSDFPMHLQDENPDGESVFYLEFDLSPEEIHEFRREVGSTLNGTLPVQLRIGSGDPPKFVVKKQGPGAAVLSRKAPQIARFVGRRLDFQYIPAVRTARAAHEVIDDIVARELELVENDERYQDALRRVANLQAPILKRISRNVTKSLREFLPDVVSVKVKISSERRYESLRLASEILVDDGTPTPLEAKGDGVVSLAAVSLLRYVSTAGSGNRNLILAVEEPESHLHPESIHRLREAMRDIASEHQVIITTHNPAFVERHDIEANILVERRGARSAGSIADIRASLGVRVGDNLRNSEVVLVVEGESDRTAMLALLPNESSALAAALRDNRLAIDALGGGTNLSYKITSLRNSLCAWHCLLDHDDTGRAAFQAAEADGLATLKDVTFARCGRLRDAELEDWFDPAIYAGYFTDAYGGVLDNDVYRAHGGKWSQRVKNTFEVMGKPWSDGLERKIKLDVADLVAQRPDVAVRRRCMRTLASLVARLEHLLQLDPR